MAMAMRTAMIITTTMSSMSVKPSSLFSPRRIAFIIIENLLILGVEDALAASCRVIGLPGKGP